ncbi:MAG TPA: hypothetical protein VD846_03605 [Allosphingosinicella sp.]|nr:hypothetical protein [Allosphingosinicella sp.]
MADISQRVVFTVIPDGIAGDEVRLNLHVAPRLTLAAGVTPDTLIQFPAWQDWADTINAADIHLLVNGDTVAVTRAAVADPRIWSALLPPSTRVASHKFEDLRGANILTYPLAALGAAIESDYVAMAGEEGGELPSVRDLGKHIRYLPKRGLDREKLISLLQSDEDLTDPDLAIALLAEYHRPLGPEMLATAKKQGKDDPHEDSKYLTQKRVALPDPAKLAASFDFHRIVSALGQHAALMRACGLVVPLKASLSDIADGHCKLQAKVEWDGAGIATEADICPVTHAGKGDGEFRAIPRHPGALDGGWLRLDPARFDLVSMDVDGGGLSLKNFAINLPNIEDESFDDERFDSDKIVRTGTPRLRTAGLQLAQKRRGKAIGELFKGSFKLEEAVLEGDQPELFAEDLIRGWRADVEDDKSGRWQSLLRFDGTYVLPNENLTLETEDEETVLRLAAGKAADGSEPGLLKATEALFAWSGWSLAAPQPGRAIMPDDVTHAEAPNELPDGLPLHVSARAHKGSLPVLRFGRTYRVRLRYADLAGGGLAWTPDGSAPAAALSRPYRFGRYEPAEAPVLTLIEGEKEPKDGESMARAALRTMDDASTNDTEVRRNVVPPRVGIRFAELHGVLDHDGRPDPAAYKLLKDRDSDYESITVETHAFDPQHPEQPGAVVKTDFAVAKATHQTPYLYDPQTAGCALYISGVPGIDPDKLWPVSFVADDWDPDAPHKWPEALGFTLLASETGVTGYEASTRTFRVVLAKGERARIRLSALVPRRDLAKFKLLDRLRETAEAGSDPEAQQRYSRARSAARRGRHWMFTPWRKVELVHALQRPLVKPDYENLGAGRSRGNVTASISYATPIHCKSTARIDTSAAWFEIDDQGGDGPIVKPFQADAFSREFARLDHPEGVARRLNGKHVFEDTRARFVAYRMRATTRFREFMPPEIRADAKALVRESAIKAVWVPSSSPPAAPVVRYVVPTFGWFESGEPGGKQRSWRDGGGLRVYLDRPWYSSGSNEMLAVLLPATAVDPGDGPLKDFVSQWGADPIWTGPKVATIAPKATNFPRRIEGGPVPYDFGDPTDSPQLPDGAAAGSAFHLRDLVPQGAPDGIRVNAVPHAVGYDPVRGLWYADIVVRPGGAYFPFVRLALARYQPHSVVGCELSSAVMASFQQLSPDRVAIVTPVSLFLDRGRSVSIYGRLPTGGTPLPRAGTVTVRLQRLKPGGDPDLDWRDTPQGQRPDTPLPGGPVASGRARRSGGDFHIPRSRLDAAQRVKLAEATVLAETGRVSDLLERVDLLELMLPPLIHEETLILPSKGGDRLRLLITETETYATEAESGGRNGPARDRIVYAAAIEV